MEFSLIDFGIEYLLVNPVFDELFQLICQKVQEILFFVRFGVAQFKENVRLCDSVIDENREVSFRYRLRAPLS